MNDAKISNPLEGEPSADWLVTGCAGFIGSHLVAALLAAGHRVRGIDDFSTGSRRNIDALRHSDRFTLYEGDICDPGLVQKAVKGARYVLHQAAVASVPASIADPARTARVNVEGFCTVAKAAAAAEVKRFVYASSSAVYGDDPELPKTESMTGRMLSPYAASKLADEHFAEAIGATDDMTFVGLRYFNVFGPRQDPAGPYAAVIPIWAKMLLTGGEPMINGDPTITRDFTYIDNVVNANIRAAYAPDESANRVYNIGGGTAITLSQLFDTLRMAVMQQGTQNVAGSPRIGPARPGDILHSVADVSQAAELLGHHELVSFATGILNTVAWAAESDDD